MEPPTSILITGASSGLGAALARAYAGPGITLHLGGRDQARLGAVCQACRDLGAAVEGAPVDTTHAEALAGWVARADRAAPLDLVIANAGISAGTGQGGEDGAQARRIFATNLDGVVNTLLPAIEVMAPRGRGQLAIMSSLAGFRGLPGAPAYCGSKAAVRVWGESLRGSLAAQGLKLTVICPGFVKSPMTDVNPFPMPMLMEADQAARIIQRGLAKNRPRLAFPWPLATAVWLLAALPPRVTDWALRKLPEKG